MSAAAKVPTSKVPDLRVEKKLLRSGYAIVAACDEVGRGALSGPVTVGMTLVTIDVRRPPSGLRDSKLLTPAARQALECGRSEARVSRGMSGSAPAVGC